jgi:bifunctional non-homologous end joining protein LigD
MPSNRIPVKVEDRELTLSNLDKILYPDTGFAKAQVIDYYTRIAPVLVPHLRNRPLTLKRYPDGVEGEAFYEKNCPAYRPDWFQTAKVWSGQNRRYQDYCLVQDLPSLVWVANLASLELHTSLSHAEALGTPTSLVFDLDPGPPADIIDCCNVALALRQLLEADGLQAFAKTSGNKGAQLYVPIDPAPSTRTSAYAKGLAEQLEQALPDLVLSSMAKRARKGKVFIDWSQNNAAKTTVAAYSLRGVARPTVSTPLTWDEVADASEAADLTFTAADVVERVGEHGDLFDGLDRHAAPLP